jgi:hypothetical protein
MNDEQIGPAIYVIPRQEIMSCVGCKYYKRQMLKSGFKPIYAEICSHEKSPAWSPMGMSGNLRAYNHVIETPDWCPILLEKPLNIK